MFLTTREISTGLDSGLLTFLSVLLLSACCWVPLVFLSLSLCLHLSPSVFLHSSICDHGSVMPSRAAYVLVSVASSAPSSSPHITLSRRPGQWAALAPAQQGTSRTTPQRLHELQTQDAVPEKLKAWGKDLRELLQAWHNYDLYCELSKNVWHNK